MSDSIAKKDYYFGHAEGNTVVLSGEEFNHLKNVKRIKTGDTILVTDGNGNLFTCQFAGNNSPLTLVKCENFVRKNYTLHIAVAPTKNIDRIEWFLEKAVESGIDIISFLQCRHSERKEIKTDRLTRVAIAAMKQSKKTFLPVINDMIGINEFIQKNHVGTKLIFTQNGNGNFKSNYKANNGLLAVIGPEGDFHTDEINLAIENGFQSTSLGDSRLRTETAALTVCTLFNFLNTQ